jgi:hypothetical protein
METNTLKLNLISPVYISGPITGIENANKEAFSIMTDYVQSLGYEVINPRALDIPEGTREEDIWKVMMRLSLQGLLESNSVVVLPGWEHSYGANMEVDIADELDMPIFDSTFTKI